MKKIAVLVLFFSFVLISSVNAADLNPLSTTRAETVGDGMLRTDVIFSVERLDDGTKKFHDLPGLRVTWGLSDITDLIVYFSMVYREGPNFNDKYGAGDVFASLRVSPWEGPWGRLGFLISTKSPDANDKYGLGSDVQDFFLMGLYTLDINDRFKLSLNAGMHAIGDETEMFGKYHYLFAYGVGAEYLVSDHFSIVGDIFGTTGSDEVYEIHEATLGVVFPVADGWECGLTGSAGISASAPDWSASFVISRLWNVPGSKHRGAFFADEAPLSLSYYPFPMQTKEAWTTRPNNLSTTVAFSAEGHDDDSVHYRLPVFDLRYGLAGGVDVGLSAPFQFLSDSPEHGDAYAFGATRMNFKVSPWEYKTFRFGILTEMKLPNTHHYNGIGSPEMDLTFMLLSSGSLGKLKIHGNYGLLIEGKKGDYSSQRDYFIFALGAEYEITDWASIYCEYYNRTNLFDDPKNRNQLGGGLRFLISKFAVSLYGEAGLGYPAPCTAKRDSDTRRPTGRWGSV
jgi:hypothetical protein